MTCRQWLPADDAYCGQPARPYPCDWCDREKQPLLCTRCWGKERQREENTPVSAEEDNATALLLALAARNRRLLAEPQTATA